MSAILYDYWRSSAAYRLRIALNLAGIAYDSVPVDLLSGAHREQDNLDRNPQGLVPTLEIDGLTLTQSLAVLEYLDETRGLGFLPTAPAERARVRALSYAIAMEIHPVCNLSVARFAVAASDEAISMEGWMQNFIGRGLAAFENMLPARASGRFCHSDEITMADICLVPQIYNARRWKADISGLPRIGSIMDELEPIPQIAAAHPDRCKPPA